MDSDHLLNAPSRSFIRSCVAGPPATDTVLIDITDPPDTILRGGLTLLCSQEVATGHEAILCPRYQRSHRDATNLRQRGIARS